MHRHGWTVLTRVRLRACWVRIGIPPMGSSLCPDIRILLSSALVRAGWCLRIHLASSRNQAGTSSLLRYSLIHSFTQPNPTPRPLPQLHQSHQGQEEESDIQGKEGRLEKS